MSVPFLPLLARPRNRGWGSAGEMWYQDENGIWQSIERPIDWATTPYFLGIDQATGIPTWMALSGVVTDIVRGAHIASTVQLFPPTITRVVESGHVASTTVLYPPSIALLLDVSGGTIASGSQLFAPSLVPPEPWFELGRQETLSSGRLVLSGLNLSGIHAVQFHIGGVVVTDDDTSITMRFIIDGSEVSSGYQWVHSIRSSGAGVVEDEVAGDTSVPLTRIAATQRVGNAAEEAMNAIVTAYSPASSSQHKRAFIRSSYVSPNGDVHGMVFGAGQLNTTGSITGIIVQGSSDLTDGWIIALGVE